MTTPPRRHPNVVRAEELPTRPFTRGTRFGLASRPLGRATGAKAIGCSHYEVPPGRAAFPHHYHCANEESIYVLEGEGELRIGSDKIPVTTGDYATFPVGPGHPHQLRNTGATPLRYLCFSTMHGTDVVGYPDSRKLGALAFGPEGQQWARQMNRAGEGLDYYDGEE